jgi:hypothetical protein
VFCSLFLPTQNLEGHFKMLPEIAAGQNDKEAGGDEVDDTDPQANVLPEAGWFDNRRKHGGNVRKYAGQSGQKDFEQDPGIQSGFRRLDRMLKHWTIGA